MMCNKERVFFYRFKKNPMILSRYSSLDHLKCDSRCALAIITNSLSCEFPRKRPQPGLMAQSACSDNSMCGPTVGTPPQNFLLARVPMEGALSGHRRGKTCARCLVFRRTGGQMTGTRRSHAWMQRQLPSRNIANSSLTRTLSGERRETRGIRKTVNIEFIFHLSRKNDVRSRKDVITKRNIVLNKIIKILTVLEDTRRRDKCFNCISMISIFHSDRSKNIKFCYIAI